MALPKSIAVFGVLAGILLTQPATAQTLPFDQPADLVEALVVKARTPGPAWWKVSDADTTVWILGSPGLLPADVRWNDTVLKRRLTGANRLILPARGDASILGMVGLLAKIKTTLFDPRPIRDRLPPPLFQRLDRQWNDPANRNVGLSIGISGSGVDLTAKREPKSADSPQADEFGGAEPKTIILALMALQLADEPLGKLVDEPAKRAEAFASSLKIHDTYAGSYDELAAFKIGTALPDSAQQACLAGALDILEAQDANVATKRARAQAWAEGDVATALGRRDRFDMLGSCPTPAPVKAMGARNITAAVSAIRSELRRKGHAVAVVDLTDLLQVGGVLDQLAKVKGVTITAPDVLND